MSQNIRIHRLTCYFFYFITIRGLLKQRQWSKDERRKLQKQLFSERRSPEATFFNFSSFTYMKKKSVKRYLDRKTDRLRLQIYGHEKSKETRSEIAWPLVTTRVIYLRVLTTKPFNLSSTTVFIKLLLVVCQKKI